MLRSLFLKSQRNLFSPRAIGYKLAMGNARYFQETLFVTLEHFAKLTRSTPEKVRARLLTFDDAKGTWSGDLAGGEKDGQFWVSASCVRQMCAGRPKIGRSRAAKRAQVIES